MVIWEPVDSVCSAEEWDSTLLASLDGNVFQSYAWGEFKRVSGWKPLRWLARDKDHAVVAMAQILTKSFMGGSTIGWAPGGPVVLLPQTERDSLPVILDKLLEQLSALGKRICVRFYSLLPHDCAMAYAFGQRCVRPIFLLNSGYSFCLDLHQPSDVLKKRMTSKHRYYVKKALAENVEWKVTTHSEGIRELSGLHAEMVRAKGLGSLGGSFGDVATLCRILGKQATIFTGSVNGAPVASCLVMTFGEKAFYALAATGKPGREISASYGMLYQLLEYLQGQGVTHFDFGGVNPKSPTAEGVNHFKRGFGGELVQYLGEWEWTNSEWLRWGLNLAIRYRWRG